MARESSAQKPLPQATSAESGEACPTPIAAQTTTRVKITAMTQESGTHLSVPTVTMSYAYGDMTTNLIQPFWASPLLSVAGLRFGDIMGYCVILAATLFLFNLVILLFIPLQM